MIYLYRDSEDSFSVSREEKDGAIASINDDESQYMDIALDIISGIGVATAHTLFDKTKTE